MGPSLSLSLLSAGRRRRETGPARLPRSQGGHYIGSAGRPRLRRHPARPGGGQAHPGQVQVRGALLGAARPEAGAIPDGGQAARGRGVRRARGAELRHHQRQEESQLLHHCQVSRH